MSNQMLLAVVINHTQGEAHAPFQLAHSMPHVDSVKPAATFLYGVGLK
jgi:hypothetical protein